MLTINEGLILAEGQRKAWPPAARRKAKCLLEIRYRDFPELISGKVYEVAAMCDALGRATSYVVFLSHIKHIVVPQKEFNGGFEWEDDQRVAA